MDPNYHLNQARSWVTLLEGETWRDLPDEHVALSSAHARIAIAESLQDITTLLARMIDRV